MIKKIEKKADMLIIQSKMALIRKPVVLKILKKWRILNQVRRVAIDIKIA